MPPGGTISPVARRAAGPRLSLPGRLPAAGVQALKSKTSRTRPLDFQTPMPTQWKAGFFMFRHWPPFEDFSDWKNRCDARTAVLAYDAVRQTMFSTPFAML